MTRAAPQSAPIPALIDYYQRLRADPDEAGRVAPFGYSQQKISFRVVLETDGRLYAIQDAREQADKRLTPTPMIVPGQSKPSGQGINPGFLWDNAQYMLGVKSDDPNPDRTARAFAAFKQRHLDLADQIDDEAYAAVCRFLEQWNPTRADQAEGSDLLDELSGGFGVFQIRGLPGYVHQREAVNDYWKSQLNTNAEQADGNPGQSLVSGRSADLARLHEPKIKGVTGGQSSGAVLVGFNEDAYASYGKSQSFNAPIAEDEAFEYCSALNRLLSSGEHRVQIGDATVVFWADRPTEDESLITALFGRDISGEQEAEHAGTTQRLKHFWESAKRGSVHEGIDDPEAPFYVLGLSPNAARISVRFWLAGTVRQFGERLQQHIANLAIVGEREDEPLTTRRLLRETAREAKDIPPQLAGEVTRAILAGTRYPRALPESIVRRIRADRTMNHRRASILKAYLIRNHKKEVPVSLDRDHPAPAYHMGRFFAALEKTQQDALGQNLNKTIKDGYFSTASATPAAVFPRIIRMHQHHIEKLDGGLKVNREKLIQEICSHINQFPPHLPLEKQGMFHIGYYHQREDFFTKRETAGEASADES